MKAKRPVALLMLSEILFLLAAFAVLMMLPLTKGAPLWQRIGAVGVACCALAAVYGGALLCHRARKQSVFTAETVKILGQASGALAAMGVLLIPLGLPLMNWLLAGLPEVHIALRAALPAFTALGLSLMVRTVQLLMRRAVSMQDENDLTV